MTRFSWVPSDAVTASRIRYCRWRLECGIRQNKPSATKEHTSQFSLSVNRSLLLSLSFSPSLSLSLSVCVGWANVLFEFFVDQCKVSHAASSSHLPGWGGDPAVPLFGVWQPGIHSKIIFSSSIGFSTIHAVGFISTGVMKRTIMLIGFQRCFQNFPPWRRVGPGWAVV